MKKLSYILMVLIASIVVLNDIKAQSTVLDGFYIKEHVPERKPVTYGSGGPFGSMLMREADVMWSKRIWRRIDLKQKINHPLYYPTSPIQDRKSMFDVIKDAIINEGTLTAYDPGPLGTDDEFTVPMTVDAVKGKLSTTDTVFTEDINTGDFVQKVVTTNVTASEIKAYDLKEDWFFDRERSIMDVRVIGICPMKENIDPNTGEVRGLQPLFWVYFPEARFVFANAVSFNRTNDAEQRTFEDIFWKRQFGSYILKESNVFDRFINEYKTGLDQLLEAERIKTEIFNSEHDVWHF